ncbi:hypothetical protein ACNO7P_08145, partial [Bisgaard Taxon 45]
INVEKEGRTGQFCPPNLNFYLLNQSGRFYWKSSGKNDNFNKCDPFNTFLTLIKPLAFYNLLFLKNKIKKEQFYFVLTRKPSFAILPLQKCAGDSSSVSRF